MLDPADCPVAGVSTFAPPPAWRATDELARVTGRVGARTLSTLTSADAPREVVYVAPAVAARVGLFGREAADAPRAQSSQAVSRGSFVGATAEVPVAPPGSLLPSIVHADVASPSKRRRDPSSVEAAHARAVVEHGDSAFRLHSGFGSSYLDAGVPLRAVTPMWASHLRLSSLQGTLASMRLAPTPGGGGSVAAGSSSMGEAESVGGGGGTPRWARSGAGTFHFTPLPSPMVAPGTPRFTGSRANSGGSSGGSVRRAPSSGPSSATNTPARASSGESGARGVRSASKSAGSRRASSPASPVTHLEADRSALAVLRWQPCGMKQQQGQPAAGTATALAAAAAVAASTGQHAHALSGLPISSATHALVSSLPPPVPMLRSQAAAHTFVSRGSSQGITPRARRSKLDQALGRLLAARGGNGATVSFPSGNTGSLGDVCASSWGGGSSFSEGGGSTGVVLVLPPGAGGAATPGDAAAGMTRGGYLPPLPSLSSTTARSPSPRGRASPGKSPRSGVTSSFSASASGSASMILVGPASERDASGVLRGVTRADIVSRVSGLRSPGLVRMRSGQELISLASVQARAIRRLDANHNTDLTHGWIHEGTWPELNLGGSTLSPTRRKAVPIPLEHEEAASVRPGGARYANAIAAGAVDAGGVVGGGSSSLEGMDGGDDNRGGTRERRMSYFEAQGSETPRNLWAAPGAAVGAMQQQQQQQHDVTKQRTALGNEMLSAAVAAPAEEWRGGPSGVHQAQYTAARLSLEQAAPIAHTGAPGDELEALAAFERARGIESPHAWPNKVLRAKLRASGVLAELGLGATGALEEASRDALISAHAHIRFAKAKKELLAPRAA